MSAEDTRYDDTLYTMAQQSGGVQEFLNNISSFLRRHTNFFNGTPNGQWEDQLLRIFHKEHAKLARTSVNDKQPISGEELKPNEGKGCNLPNYAWTQTLKEIELKVPLNCEKIMRARDINIEINRKSLKVGLKGQTPIVNGELFKEIKYNESTWMLDEGNTVTLTLEKVNKNVWWDRLMLTDPAISLKEIEPEKVQLTDLDAKQRETVEKMLQNQRQKQLGLPGSGRIEHKKLEIFEDFKAKHPELDFSKCKFNDEVKVFKEQKM